jgi:hypothetical protein
LHSQVAVPARSGKAAPVIYCRTPNAIIAASAFFVQGGTLFVLFEPLWRR